MPKHQLISFPEGNKKEVSGSNQQGFSFFEDKGDYRETQEDALVCLTDLNEEHLSQLTPTEVGQRLWSAHKQLDANYQGTAGTTAASNYYDGKGNIVTATLADAASFAAVYDKNGQVLKVERLNSITHKPTDPNEATRIREAGGVVMNGRVNQIIAVSRAIGDKTSVLEGITWAGKGRAVPNGKALITAESQIDITSVAQLTHDLNHENIDRIEIIVTCDGFTDGAGRHCQEKEDHEHYLMNCLNSAAGLSGEALCRHLAQSAIDDGSRDNVSVAIQTIFSAGQPKTDPVMLGVYDGHGGADAATFVAQNISTVFAQQCALTAGEYIVHKHSVYQHLPAFTRDHPQYSETLNTDKKNYFLDNIGFDNTINELTILKTKFLDKNQNQAAKDMDTLIVGLNTAKKGWDENPKNIEQFVDECKHRLETAKHSSLKDHRDANKIIRALFNAINYIASFFSNTPLIKTNSIHKVLEFKNKLKINLGPDEACDNNKSPPSP